MASRRSLRSSSGFTLLELLVVVAVLGVISGVAVFGVGQLTGNAQDAACDIEARTITVAQEAHRVTTGAYGDLDALVDSELLSERPELHDVGLVAGGWQLVPLGACADVLAAGVEDGPDDDPAGGVEDLGDPVADESDCSAGQIDLNHAPPAALTAIIHIGVVRAAQIPSLRPFDSVEDLVRVNGIGPARLADILAQGVACV